MEELTRPQPVDRRKAHQAQEMVQDPGLGGGHHDLPHQRGDDRRHHQGHQHHGPQNPAADDPSVQQQRHADTQTDLDHHRDRGIDEGELDRIGEERVAWHLEVVAEPDELEQVGILEEVTGEAVVDAQQKRIQHADQEEERGQHQEVRQDRRPPVSADGGRMAQHGVFHPPLRSGKARALEENGARALQTSCYFRKPISVKILFTSSLARCMACSGVNRLKYISCRARAQVSPSRGRSGSGTHATRAVLRFSCTVFR